MDSIMDHGRLGVITEGSFTGGLSVRLDSPNVEHLQVGSFVVLEGERQRYFSLIHDLQLRVTDQGVVADPPRNSPFIRRALRGVHTYAAATVRPSLALDNEDDPVTGAGVRAVRTIPGHFAILREAGDEDFDVVFGSEDKERFALGSPIANEDVMIPIDLVRLVERSNGIFGQTGTGKSVLARLILFGLIRSNLASTLIFDMHDEYSTGDPNKPEIPGLLTFFGSSRIKIYSLDRGAAGSDPHITFGLNQIRPADIELLAGELDLRDTFDATSHTLVRAFGNDWLKRLLEIDSDELTNFCAEYGAHPAALEGLRRKLRYLESSGYIVKHQTSDPVQEIVHHLERKHHVVIQFGRYMRLRDYMLVANLLTRRIHDRYTERASGSSQRERELPPLLVVLEEAHKFLSPEAARQSIFGTIAREMRKFGVSLLVVDQRPSGIDSEILSQLGTRVTGLLTDPADIEAVLSGTADRSAMRAMLASLEPSQQCLVVGHAIPMPMILRTRDYSLHLAREMSDDGEEPGALVGKMLGPWRGSGG